MPGYCSAAVGTVVENDIVAHGGRQVQHIRETVPDGLGNVDVPRNYQMIGENGCPVYQDIVLAALPSLEREGVLMLHVILFTKRTAVVEDGKPARIGLQGDQNTAEGHRAGIGTLEGAVLGRHRRPHRQLIVNEFVDIACHSYKSAVKRSRMAEYSHSKLGVRIFLPMASSNWEGLHHRPSETSALSGSKSG